MTSTIFTQAFGLDRKTWVFQFDSSLTTGYTFQMCFIALKKKDWKGLVPEENVPELCEHIYLALLLALSSKLCLSVYNVNKSSTILRSTHTWGYDQSILTRRILEQGLCSLPVKNKIWTAVDLECQPSMLALDALCINT